LVIVDGRVASVEIAAWAMVKLVERAGAAGGSM